MCTEDCAAFSGGSPCSPLPRTDLYSCHRCGLRFTISGSREQLQVLQSHWRIVLACNDCLVCIRSATVCSYCFMGFSELEKGFPELEKGLLSCFLCSCKVHRSCVPLHHRKLWYTPLDSSKFMCMDCCPIQNLGKNSSKSGESTSQSGFRFLLEDFLRVAKSTSEKRVTRDGNGRKNTVKKAAVVRGSTEITGKSPGSVQLDPAHIDLTVSDKELALRLHQSMNRSQRICRSLYPRVETQLTIARKMLECSSSVGSIVDSNSCLPHSKVQVKSNSLLVDGENSQSIITSSDFERENEDLSKKIRAYNAEGPISFSLKEKNLSLKSPHSTNDQVIRLKSTASFPRKKYALGIDSELTPEIAHV
ncbi:hypothetical protein KSP40_PGU016783 [Platanthera guangdongensis]|uniref:PHD-type domain-containing protein n=1 Tax=Platanthera guangdongensis TaxID=2320717 RepID=A0ABR2MY12_9ASPA